MPIRVPITPGRSSANPGVIRVPLKPGASSPSRGVIRVPLARQGGGSVYAQKSSGGGSVYAQNPSGNTGGSVYAQKGTPLGTPVQKPKSSGLLGAIGRAFKQGAKDLETAAVSSPAGIYLTGKTILNPTVQSLKHGPDSPQAKHAQQQLRQLGKSLGQQLVADVQHPLRHPGNTLLDVASLASLGGGTAARLAAAGRVARAGEGSAAVARAITTKPVFTREILGQTIPASANPAVRLTQRARDVRLAKQAAAGSGPAALKLAKRGAPAVSQQLRTTEKLARAEHAAVISLSRRLTPAQQQAFRVVADGRPIEQVMRLHTQRIAELRGENTPAARLEITRQQNVLKRLAQAKAFVTQDEAGRPVFRPGVTARNGQDLPRIYAAAQSSAGSREALLTRLELITPTGLQTRKSAAGRVIGGASFIRETVPVTAKTALGTPVRIAGQKAEGAIVSLHADGSASVFYPRFRKVQRVPQTSLEALGKGKLVGEESFTNPGGLFISEAQRRGPLGQAALSVRGAIGRPRKPPGLTQPFTGASKLQALETETPVARIGQQGLEAQRFGSALQTRDILAQHGFQAPLAGTQLKDYRFLRTDISELPPELKSVISKADRGEPLTASEHVGISRALGAFRDVVLSKPHELSPDDIANLQQLAEQGKGVFVPRVLTKEFERQYVRLENLIGRRATGFIDTTNNATKFAILYLKVAYATPNLLGNLALNLTQQGFAAPANLARASILARRIPPETWARIDALMGEGLSTSLDTQQGALAGAVHLGAQFWSKFVDIAPRRAAFVYEARRIGAKSPAELERLVSGEDSRIGAVTTRANRAIINYDRLGPVEKEVVRRVIFFYPWVKGSTAFAGHFVKENPAQAATLAQLGQVGQQEQASLAPVPSYARGLFPVGTRGSDVLTVNPASTSILGTPADLAQTIANLASGSPGFEGASQLTPSLQALLSLVTRRDALGRPFRGSPLAGTAKGLYQGIPLYVLEQRLRGKAKSKTYPNLTQRDALMQYLIGGLAPRPTDVNALNRQAFAEKRGR